MCLVYIALRICGSITLSFTSSITYPHPGHNCRHCVFVKSFETCTHTRARTHICMSISSGFVFYLTSILLMITWHFRKENTSSPCCSGERTGHSLLCTPSPCARGCAALVLISAPSCVLHPQLELHSRGGPCFPRLRGVPLLGIPSDRGLFRSTFPHALL